MTADAHGFDETSLAPAVLLRQPVPESAAQRRELWQALGVATDSVSGTILVWQLRPPRRRRVVADDARPCRPRTDQPPDAARAGPSRPGPIRAPGQTVSVCENPQVLQAAAHAGTETPLLCLSGNPATAGTRLLHALVVAGHPVRYHGDFDWPGIAITGRILALGAAPWRMSAADYRTAVTRLNADHAVAPTGKPLPTAWDPVLASAMSTHGLAVHEEFVLSDLLSDLRGPPLAV